MYLAYSYKIKSEGSMQSPVMCTIQKGMHIDQYDDHQYMHALVVMAAANKTPLCQRKGDATSDACKHFCRSCRVQDQEQ